MAVLGAQRWSREDDQYIRETMPCTREEVARAARKLGRTRQAVQNRVRKYRGRVRRRWTPDQDAMLLDIRLTPHTERHEGKSAFADIAQQLGVSVQAARDRYDHLMREAGHKGGQWTVEGLWTPEEDAAIQSQIVPGQQRVSNGTWHVVAQRIGRSECAVRVRASKLRRGLLDGTAEPESEGLRRR